jgi:hypothetical protein
MTVKYVPGFFKILTDVETEVKIVKTVTACVAHYIQLCWLGLEAVKARHGS